VTVLSHDHKFLARGYWNPRSQIQVRILTWQDEEIDEDWWRRMLRRAIDARRKGASLPEAQRLVNAENDYLPGLIIDRYGGWLVLQALTLGIDTRKSMIAQLLLDLLRNSDDIVGIYERSDVDVRRKECLDFQTGTLAGQEPPEHIVIHAPLEREALVDIRRGHKTGFYLDQCSSRQEVYFIILSLPPDSRVLNLFCYTATFVLDSLHLPNVTEFVNVDASLDALELAEAMIARNNSEWLNKCEFIQADAFEYLRAAVQRGEQFDVIVCDPPKFAHNAQQVQKAARGYKDLNLHCFKLLKPGGYLMTFSCSGAVSADLFQKIVFGALVDSGRQAQILRHLGPSDDHPVALTFPEGAYLKGLLLRVY
jgi:23S rRNA (cytosine1962-C5)-methyltransferase